MRKAQKARYYAKTRKNKRRRGKSWTPEEDCQIIAKHRPTDRQLSRRLGRSMQAIYRRRSKLREVREELRD